MARGPFWLCTELKVIRANLDKPDWQIAAMLPGRKEKAVSDFRSKLGIYKRGPTKASRPERWAAE